MTTIIKIGPLSSSLSFVIGWVLFGLASLRARVFPATISIAIVLGGNAGWPPRGVLIGLAVAALGGWLVHQDRTARLLPEPAVS